MVGESLKTKREGEWELLGGIARTRGMGFAAGLWLREREEEGRRSVVGGDDVEPFC